MNAVKKVLAAVAAVAADVAKLKNPVLDANIAAFVVSLVSPFGLNVGPGGSLVVGVLLAVGGGAAVVEKVLADVTPAA